MQDGGTAGKTTKDAEGQCDDRDNLRLPEGEGEFGDTGGHSSNAGISDRVADAGERLEQGDGVGHSEDCAGERDQEQQEEASGGVRVGCVLQWEESWLLHKEEANERR